MDNRVNNHIQIKITRELTGVRLSSLMFQKKKMSYVLLNIVLFQNVGADRIMTSLFFSKIFIHEK